MDMNRIPVIDVSHLSKQYRLGTINHGTLRQDLQSWWARVNGRPDPNIPISDANAEQDGSAENGSRLFQALNDVSFTLYEGETLGIVGKNGAGKSTLLKILCRVTAPTEGSVRIRGRIASLLEVGTGFHPDLSGKENVFLNGSILGMPKEEIKKKFDEIVAFSGLEKFIDTPVKRYSSGMYVRLAFSVAAHLEAEILIVDEVLAVGDFEFQRKCMEKLREVTTGRKTVILVSHNMAAVQNLCSRAIFLERGTMVAQGTPAEIITGYISRDETSKQGQAKLSKRAHRTGSGRFRFTDAQVACGEGTDKPTTGLPLTIKIDICNASTEVLDNVDIAVGIDNHLGDRVAFLSTAAWRQTVDRFGQGTQTITFEFSRLPLIPGHYSATLFGTSGQEICDWVPLAFSFDVVRGIFYSGEYDIPPGQGNILLDYTVH